MVHNGIEYALMQAYAEGFQILEETDSNALPAAERFALNIAAIAEVWRHGSIVSSQLLDVIAKALGEDTTLRISPASSTTPARAAGPCRRRSSAPSQRWR